jgi:hypothetical protein
MEVFLPLFDELTPASGILNTVGLIGELSLNVVRVFVKEKSNDCSLLGLHPAVKV